MKKAHNKNLNINTINYTLLTVLVVYLTFNETIICPSINFISIIKFNDMFVLFKIFIFETNVQHIKHIKYVLKLYSVQYSCLVTHWLTCQICDISPD